MGFLKKVGMILAKATQIVYGLGPIETLAYPKSAPVVATVTRDLEQMALVIQEVETIGQVLGHPGPDKLKAATPLMAQIVLQSSILANHKIAKPELFQQGAAKLADGMADILNSLEDKVEATDKVA